MRHTLPYSLPTQWMLPPSVESDDSCSSKYISISPRSDCSLTFEHPASRLVSSRHSQRVPGRDRYPNIFFLIVVCLYWRHNRSYALRVSPGHDLWYRCPMLGKEVRTFSLSFCFLPYKGTVFLGTRRIFLMISLQKKRGKVN